MSEISTFVHDALAAGKSREDIRQAMMKAGWPEDEVAEAVGEYADVPFDVPVPRRRAHLSARDAFMHLVAFLTLYITAFGLGTLLFQFVNMIYPDPLARGEWYHESMYGLLRSAAASVIVGFPIYLWLTVALQREYTHDPERRTSPIRRWLTYITLFVAAAFVISYLIALTYQLLGGDLGEHFAIKVLIVLAIAGGVFGFYLPGLRKDERQAHHGLRPASQT